jgi:hypothetical protein
MNRRPALLLFAISFAVVNAFAQLPATAQVSVANGKNSSGTNSAAPASAAGFTGVYHAGDGLGFNDTIKIEGDNRFSFDWIGCLGKTIHNKGHITTVAGEIRLSPHAEQQPSALIPIHWGARTYLVEATSFLDFCNDINAGSEPRTDTGGSAYLKAGDEKKTVAGLPSLPAPWSDFLLKQSLEGKVIKVIGQSAQINLGSDDGLRAGMRLSAWGKSGMDVTLLRVKSTEAKTALVELDGNEHLGPEERQLLWHIDTGQVVSSRYESPLKNVQMHD